MAYVYDVTGVTGDNFSIDWDARSNAASLYVMKRGATVASSNESYQGTISGLSCAIARAHYLAGERGSICKKAMAKAKAIFEMGVRKAHAAWLDASQETVAPQAPHGHDGVLQLNDNGLYRGDHLICKEGEVLGVLAEMAGEDSFLVGCGAYADMLATATRIWDTHPNLEGIIPDTEIAYPVGSRVNLIPVALSKPVVDELNRCLAAPGRIVLFPEFLASLYENCPETALTEAQIMKAGIVMPGPFTDPLTIEAAWGCNRGLGSESNVIPFPERNAQPQQVAPHFRSPSR